MKLIVAFRKFANVPKNDFERTQKEIELWYIKQTNKQKNKYENIICVKIGVA
jgi:hypothetical protein